MNIGNNIMAIEQALLTPPKTERLIPGVDFLGQHPDYAIQPGVIREVIELHKEGYNIALVDPPDPHRPDAVTQGVVSTIIQRLEKLEEDERGAGYAALHSSPTMNTWGKFTRTALALHPVYRASTAETLGEGIDPDALSQPRFKDGKGEDRLLSALDLAVRGRGDQGRANRTRDAFHEFVGQTIDPMSRLIYAGSRDGEAIRNRAAAGMEMARAHISSTARGRQDLASASLGCGAAGPVYELVRSVRAEGSGEFSKVILVDKDPMALASAAALGDATQMGDVVELQLRDLLNEPLTSYIKSHSVDVVDLLGLFEYLPEQHAIQLLKKVKDIVRPGGIIVFANMLKDRPQQKFFDDVVKWYRLCQRSLREIAKVVEAAGFDPRAMITDVPAYEGVYAVCGIKVKDDGEGSPSLHVVRGAGKTAINKFT